MLLPGNSAQTKYEERQTVWRRLKKICIHRKKYAFIIKFQLKCSSIFSGYRTISPESFPFLSEIFLSKIELKKLHVLWPR